MSPNTRSNMIEPVCPRGTRTLNVPARSVAAVSTHRLHPLHCRACRRAGTHAMSASHRTKRTGTSASSV